MMPFEDPNARYRFFGVVVWFLLFMGFVPDWYANPVNFVPKETVLEQATDKSIGNVLFSEVYRLPNDISSDQEIEQAREQAQQFAAQASAQKAQPQANPIHEQPQSSENPHSQSDEKVGLSSSQDNSHLGRAGQWLVLIASYRESKAAEELREHLEALGYTAAVKFYAEQKIYSVRVINVESKAKAQTVKKKLDKMFNLNDSIIRYSE